MGVALRRELRVGTDLCSVPDVARSVGEFGERYLRRLFTDAEISYSTDAPALTAQRLAARFAAKEATIKVLRPRGPRPPWRDIEVVRRPDGSCEMALDGAAADLAASAGLVSIAVSLTHEGDLANAVVIAEMAADMAADMEGTSR